MKIRTLHTKKIKGAAVQHQCDDCLDPIQRGDPYVSDTLVEGKGKPYNWITCQYCEAWRPAILPHLDEEDLLDRGWIQEFLDTCFDDETDTYMMFPSEKEG